MGGPRHGLAPDHAETGCGAHHAFSLLVARDGVRARPRDRVPLIRPLALVGGHAQAPARAEAGRVERRGWRRAQDGQESASVCWELHPGVPFYLPPPSSVGRKKPLRGFGQIPRGDKLGAYRPAVGSQCGPGALTYLPRGYLLTYPLTYYLLTYPGAKRRDVPSALSADVL